VVQLGEPRPQGADVDVLDRGAPGAVGEDDGLADRLAREQPDRVEAERGEGPAVRSDGATHEQPAGALGDEAREPQLTRPLDRELLGRGRTRLVDVDAVVPHHDPVVVVRGMLRQMRARRAQVLGVRRAHVVDRRPALGAKHAVPPAGT
jgi:hypothetical protein